MNLQTKTLTVAEISQFALQALLYEAALAPKPGLVDPVSNGAHQDMDFFTFLDSSAALAPYLTNYAEIGYTHEGTPKELFLLIRKLGIQAEKAMLTGTKQVNTHKGANFSFALLLSSCGHLLREKPTLTWPLKVADSQAIFSYVQTMTTGLLAQDFANLMKKNTLSYGERLYLDYGISGIRQEAEDGYPLLQNVALSYLREHRDLAREPKLLLLLLKLIQVTEDSNLINRGGIEGWQSVQKKAQDAYLKVHSATTTAEIQPVMQQLDQELIQKNLSPGGSADLLALSIFMGKLEGLL